jgi:2,5-diketo-D-gluconate reductase A
MLNARAPEIPLSNGVMMPALGLGTSPMNDEQTESAVISAIEAGYRLLDTAENYRNEAGVGRAIRASGIDRAEVFVTTKFNRNWHGFDEVQACFEERSKVLGLDYIDLLLIHWPNPSHGRFVDAWRGMVKLLQAGKVRAIGVSNFKPAHVQQVIDATGVVPHVNQLQLTPRIPRVEEREYHARLGIVTQAWSPLGAGRDSLLSEPLIVGIARRHSKSVAQVVLRWNVQQGIVPLPRSANAERRAQNLDVFDFSLSDADMAEMATLNKGESGTDSDRFGH